MFKLIKLNSDLQIDIFSKVFLELIEYPSYRWQLKRMINSKDTIDNAELDLKLRKLELEIIQRKNGEKSI